MRILFQGDSITDAHRDRTDPRRLSGYTQMIADSLGEGHEYFNYGISGDTTAQLLDRIGAELQATMPDIVTVLIGINDVWRRFDSNYFIPAEQTQQNAEEIFCTVRRICPNAKLIVAEPYLLPAPDKLHWRGTLAYNIQAIREAALKYADAFIPLDSLMTLARKSTPWQLLAADGVHPDEAGQRVIAEAFEKEIKKYL